MDVVNTNSVMPSEPKYPDVMALAQDLEATFLAQMLAHAKLGDQSGDFGGGPGAAHMQSFLIEAHASQITQAGGIGLSEHIYHAIVARMGGEDGASET